MTLVSLGLASFQVVRLPTRGAWPPPGSARCVCRHDTSAKRTEAPVVPGMMPWKYQSDARRQRISWCRSRDLNPDEVALDGV